MLSLHESISTAKHKKPAAVNRAALLSHRFPWEFRSLTKSCAARLISSAISQESLSYLNPQTPSPCKGKRAVARSFPRLPFLLVFGFLSIPQYGCIMPDVISLQIGTILLRRVFRMPRWASVHYCAVALLRGRVGGENR